jgi:hypothetical protein
VAVLLVIPLLSFATLLWPGRTLYRHDLTSIHYPLIIYKARLLRAGQIALWNPHVLFGFPQMAGQDVLALHPLNLLLLLPLKPHVTLTLFVVLQYVLAGWFTYGLGRTLQLTRTGSLISALAFGLCGYLMTQPTNLPILTGAVWLPLMLLLLIKVLQTGRPLVAVLFGAAVALQIVSSHPQPAFYSLLVLGAYGLFWLIRYSLDKEPEGDEKRRRILLRSGLVALAAAVCLALAFVQIAATWELKSMSSRASGLSHYFMTTYSLPPHHLLTFLFPNMWGNPVIGYTGADTFGELHAYVGLVPLMLCLWAWSPPKRDSHVVFFTVLVACAILLALGGYTPLYDLLVHVPGLNWFRAPGRWLFPASFGLAMLAGFGFDALFRDRGAAAKPAFLVLWRLLFWLNLGLCLILVAGILSGQAAIDWLSSSASGSLPEQVLATMGIPVGGIARAPLVLAAEDLSTTLSSLNPALLFIVVSNAGFVLICLWRRQAIKAMVFQIFLVTLVVVDLLVTGGTTINPVREAAYFEGQPESTAFLRQNAGLHRVFPPVYGDDVENLVDNIPIIHRLYSVRGHMSELAMERYKAFVEALPTSPALLNLAGIKYVLLEETPVYPGFMAVPVASGPEIHENTNVLPRAFIVHRVEIIPSGEAVLDRMRGGDFDPSETVILEWEPAQGTGHSAIPAQPDLRGAEIEAYSPHKIVINAHLNADGFLIFSDTYYPGWRAYVDGQEVQIHRADYLFRAIYLEEGQHVVEFRYSPLFLRIGLSLALLVILTLGAIAVYGVRSRWRTGSGAQ